MTTTRKFTLIEVIITIVVVLVLAGVLVAAVNSSRTQAKQLRCMASIRNLNSALTNYVGDYGQYPLGGLDTALAKYSITAEDLVCPSTLTSYEQFFVGRGKNRFEHGTYVVGCPSHAKGQVSYGDGQGAGVQQGTVLWNGEEVAIGTQVGNDLLDLDDLLDLPGLGDLLPGDGGLIPGIGDGGLLPGDGGLPGIGLPDLGDGDEGPSIPDVGDLLPEIGVMEFADGSKATIVNGTLRVIASFKDNQGRWYTIVRVPASSGATVIDFEVTPGSRFEVVTPAAIAGVKGTKFQVSSLGILTNYQTVVSVSEGSVEVRSLTGLTELLGVGDTATITAAITDILLDP